ncbi:ribonuclease HII [Gemmatimonadota bacterium]
MDPSRKTLTELRDLLNRTDAPEERARLVNLLDRDPRKGARDLARRARAASETRRRSLARWQAFCDPERRLWAQGMRLVAGIDEAGRGPLAGPVVAAAVVLPEDFTHHPLDDSKRMSAQARQLAYGVITEEAVSWGTGFASAAEIDRHNILGAVHLAIARALDALDTTPEFALVDGKPLTACSVPHKAMVKGDQRCRAIAAASVLAKVTRDRHMVEADARYPGYGFAEHKGYSTPEHLMALERLGPCEIHRRSFRRLSRQLELPMVPDPAAEASRQQWGRQAEEIVAADYTSRGYDIVGRRWRGGGGEIDLVCRRGDELVVVEIKAARGERAGSPLSWLNAAQRRRWRQAAAALLRTREGHRARLKLRFDLVGVQARRDGPPHLVRLEGVEP